MLWHVLQCNSLHPYPKYENGEWKSQTNWELEEMSKGENIVKWIKEQRMSWLGYLERIKDGIGCPERSSLKNWKGREEGEDPGKDGKRKQKEIFRCWEWEDGESWWQIGKIGRTLFDRPKPTLGCSANGRRRSLPPYVDVTPNSRVHIYQHLKGMWWLHLNGKRLFYSIDGVTMFHFFPEDGNTILLQHFTIKSLPNYMVSHPRKQ